MMVNGDACLRRLYYIYLIPIKIFKKNILCYTIRKKIIIEYFLYLSDTYMLHTIL